MFIYRFYKSFIPFKMKADSLRLMTISILQYRYVKSDEYELRIKDNTELVYIFNRYSFLSDKQWDNTLNKNEKDELYSLEKNILEYFKANNVPRFTNIAYINSNLV